MRPSFPWDPGRRESGHLTVRTSTDKTFKRTVQRYPRLPSKRGKSFSSHSTPELDRSGNFSKSFLWTRLSGTSTVSHDTERLRETPHDPPVEGTEGSCTSLGRRFRDGSLCRRVVHPGTGTPVRVEVYERGDGGSLSFPPHVRRGDPVTGLGVNRSDKSPV